MRKDINLKPASDEELASQAGAGSHHSFEELINRYQQRLYYFIRGKVSNHQDSEDIIQETFLRAYRHIDQYEPRYKFSTWLYVIAHRLIISHHRIKRQHQEADESIGCINDPQEKLIETEKRENMWMIARTLGQKQYEILWLRYIEGMAIKEIARVLNKTQIYIRVLLHRARLNLMKQIPQEQNPSQKTACVQKDISSWG